MSDSNSALNHIKNLSFHRMASSPGEVKAINYIRGFLEKAGIKHETESFTYSASTSILMKLAFFIVLIYIILFNLFLFTIPILIIFFDFLLIGIIYFAIKFILDMTRLFMVGKKKVSQNITAKLNGTQEKNSRKLIIFSAHWDSVSTSLGAKSKKIMLLGGFLALVFLFITSILAIWSLFDMGTLFELFRAVTVILSIFCAAPFVILILSKKQNGSVGAIDNATGVSVLLEVAKRVKEEPLENYDLIFLWCGAEELGLWGSKQFCVKNFDNLKEEYDLENSYNINIDMVGTYIGIVDKIGIISKKPMNENLNKVLEATANQLKIPVVMAKIPFGAGSDHMVLKSFAKKADKKMEITCISSDKDFKYIHSALDTPDRCSADVLNGCIDICFNALKSLDLRSN